MSTAQALLLALSWSDRMLGLLVEKVRNKFY